MTGGQFDYLYTMSGKMVSPSRVTPWDIDVADIVIGLARQPRFAGHTRRFYSVAEHSLNVAAPFIDDPQMYQAALLHDATEAYLCDVVRPVRSILPGYADIEANLARQIAKRFNAIYPWPAPVRAMDNIMLVTEARDYCHGDWPWRELAHDLGVHPLEDTLGEPQSSYHAAIELADALAVLSVEAERLAGRLRSNHDSGDVILLGEAA